MSLLQKFTRKQLESFMIDCHGFDQEQLNEWDNKADLISDIENNGHSADCVDYLAV
jgi:hypothetical protein